MIVIFGASGFIGSNMYNFYKSKGIDVTGTYASNFKKGLVKYSLYENYVDYPSLLKSRNIAIISIKIGSIDSHKTNKDDCGKKISNLKILLNKICKRSIVPVFLSTDYIFEGTTGNYTEDAPANPKTQYGLDMLDIEKHIKALTDNYLIIRLGKTYGFDINDGTLITGMLNKMLLNEKVKCAYDSVIAPTSVHDTVRGIAKLIDSGSRGIFHLSSPTTLSNFKLSEMIIEFLPFLRGSITKVRLNDLPFDQKHPLNTTLNSIKLSNLINFKYTPLRANVKKITDSIKDTKHSKGENTDG